MYVLQKAMNNLEFLATVTCDHMNCIFNTYSVFVAIFVCSIVCTCICINLFVNLFTNLGIVFCINFSVSHSISVCLTEMLSIYLSIYDHIWCFVCESFYLFFIYLRIQKTAISGNFLVSSHIFSECILKPNKNKAKKWLFLQYVKKQITIPKQLQKISVCIDQGPIL